MAVQFATCVRKYALEYIQKVYPSLEITDTPECAKPILDLVEKDVLRVQDPMMHGSRIAIIAGNNYHKILASEPDIKNKIDLAVSILAKFTQ